MTWQGALLAAHIICVTLGYGGLIVAGSGLVAPENVPRATRMFGPLLGIGLILGFALVGVLGLPHTAKWLIATYILVILGAVWGPVSMRIGVKPPVPAIGAALFFVLLVTVMTLRPY